MEPKNVLPSSEQPTNAPYPIPTESTPTHLIFKILFNIILLSSPLKWHVLSRFSQILCVFHRTYACYMPLHSDKCVYIYWLFLDLPTFRIAQITWPYMIKWIVYNKLGSKRLEAVVVYYKTLPHHLVTETEQGVYYKTLPHHLVTETEQGYEKSQLGHRSFGLRFGLRALQIPSNGATFERSVFPA